LHSFFYFEKPRFRDFVLSAKIESPYTRSEIEKESFGIVLEDDKKTMQIEEFYRKCSGNGKVFYIGDWVSLNVKNRQIYGIVRYFCKFADFRMFVYITQVTLVGIGPPFTVKSFTIGEEIYCLVHCLQEKIKMVAVPNRG